MTKVGVPGAKEGWKAVDVTMATVLKGQGYATGQFGKNHQGDRDEHLPTMHGFDEFFGNLYHLNAEEEPENEDYPKNPEFRKRFGPRGVIHSWADGKGGQKIEDTGPLTKKRMETVDEETSKAAMGFIEQQHKAGKPFFVWWNATRMHFRTHVKAENRGKSGQDEYSDGMVEHDAMVGELLKKLDELGIANDTVVMYSTDNGPHFNTWPDARQHAVSQREEQQLGRRLPRAGLRALARQDPGGRDPERHRRRTRTGSPPSPPSPATPTSRRGCSRAPPSTGAATAPTWTATTSSTT